MGVDRHIKCSYFGVYDGHKGLDCSDYLRRHLHVNLHKIFTDRFYGLKSSKSVGNTVKVSLERAFRETDEAFIKEQYPISLKTGSTATTIIILGSKLYAANVGDCRAVLCQNGDAIDLTQDQNLDREDERTRIDESGGIQHGRVNGRLQITRGFGDADCKMSPEAALEEEKGDDVSEKLDYRYLLVAPEARELILDPFKDEFIVIGSDGLFERMNSKAVVDFVRSRILNKPEYEVDPRSIAFELVRHVSVELKVKDDVTCIIVLLQRAVIETG